MRILYHHRSLAEGAEGVHIREMVDAFRRLGHQVQVHSPGGSGPKLGPNWLYRRLRGSLPGAAYEVVQAAHSAGSTAGFARALREHRPHFVYKRHARYDFGPVLAAHRAGVPVILEVNCVYSAPSLRRFEPVALPRALTRVERWTFTHAAANVAVSSALADEVCQVVPGARVAVMPNGVNLAHFMLSIDGGAVRRRLGLGPRPVVGFVGTLWRWHGLDLLVEAFGRLAGPLAHLLIVGDGETRSQLEARVEIRGLSPSVTFAGQVSHDAVPTMLAAMDVAVLPADHRRHASPMKLLEYMAMGRAIVAPRIANIEEILTEGSDSLLFEPDNVDDLAACISRLLADPTLRQSLGTAARRKVESGLTWDANAQRIVQIYEGTLGAPNSVLHIRN